MSVELDLIKRIEMTASFAFTPDEVRVLLRALGEFTAAHDTVDSSDWHAARDISMRLLRWHR